MQYAKIGTEWVYIMQNVKTPKNQKAIQFLKDGLCIFVNKNRIKDITDKYPY